MKKNILLGIISAALIPLTVYAAPKDCVYHPLQDIVRSARSEKDIEPWIKDQINFNIDFKCGGSILQLAIMRGNPHVLKILLEKGGVNPNELIDNTAFPIKGAPKVIPISFFAAFYAPRQDILNLFMEYAEKSIYQTDMNGQNILWYLEQNPVLRNTDLADIIVKNLLITDTRTQNEKERIAKAKEAEKQRQEAEKQRQAAEQKNAKGKSGPAAQKKNNNNLKSRTTGMIEEEPDSVFRPQEEDVKNVNLQASDF